MFILFIQSINKKSILLFNNRMPLINHLIKRITTLDETAELYFSNNPDQDEYKSRSLKSIHDRAFPVLHVNQRHHLLNVWQKNV